MIEKSRPAEGPAKLPPCEENYAYHFASEYVQRGWSVIPLRGKRPALASWKEFQIRRLTEEELPPWCADPTINLGIVTGKISGLIAVDCDTPEDAAFWLNGYPASPLVVQTGRGGKHIYYQMPDVLIGNRTRILGRNIDLRGEGGYCVAPPSRHPTTGIRYAWTNFGDYSLDAVPVFDPSWLGEGAARVHHRATAAAVRNGRAYIRHITAISGRGGHNATFRAACKLRDSGMRPEEALAALIEWNGSGNAQPPWSVHDLLHKVQSAYES
jgi:hypothetical protein